MVTRRHASRYTHLHTYRYTHNYAYRGPQVDLPEMKDALALLGHEEDVTNFFNSIDVDKSGTIEKSELLAVVDRLQRAAEEREWEVEAAVEKLQVSKSAAEDAVPLHPLHPLHTLHTLHPLQVSKSAAEDAVHTAEREIELRRSMLEQQVPCPPLHLPLHGAINVPEQQQEHGGPLR